jgi:NADPH:quinone reductase
MRAYVVEPPAGAFRKVDLPRPAPSAGQVLLRVHASGVNPLDTKIRAGKAAHAKQPLPTVLGLDMAGVVEEVGPAGVNAFRPGDEVYGMVGGVGGLQGTLAEMVVANADLIALKPKSLSMREAAALPLFTIMAWEGLVDRAKLREGQKVLIHAGGRAESDTLPSRLPRLSVRKSSPLFHSKSSTSSNNWAPPQSTIDP